MSSLLFNVLPLGEGKLSLPLGLDCPKFALTHDIAICTVSVWELAEGIVLQFTSMVMLEAAIVQVSNNVNVSFVSDL